MSADQSAQFDYLYLHHPCLEQKAKQHFLQSLPNRGGPALKSSQGWANRKSVAGQLASSWSHPFRGDNEIIMDVPVAAIAHRLTGLMQLSDMIDAERQ